MKKKLKYNYLLKEGLKYGNWKFEGISKILSTEDEDDGLQHLQ